MNISHSVTQTKQEKTRYQIAQKRKDPRYRERENALRRLSRIRKESQGMWTKSSVVEVINPSLSECPTSETDKHGTSYTMGNFNSANKRQKAKEQMAKKRLDPVYALKERIHAREAKARKRKDPAFLEFERTKNRQIMALKRKDPDYISKEHERARKIMAQKRKNENFAKL